MNQDGFTLLETLIVLALVGLITGVIFSIFNVGLFGLERSSIETEFQQEFRVLETLLKDDINSLYIRPLKQNNYFDGSYEQLSFFILEAGQKKEVNYQYDPYQKTVYRELITTDNKVKEKLVFFDDFKLERAEFRFYDPQAGYWVSNWTLDAKDELPSLIELDLSHRRQKIPRLVNEIYLGREY